MIIKRKFRKILGTAAIFSGLFLGTAMAVNAQNDNAASATKVVNLMNMNKAEIGTVELKEGPNGVLIHLKAENLPEGKHSFHIHTTGDCEPPGFKSAHGHLSGDLEHGFYAENGPHPGDFPNVYVHSDGMVEAEFYNDRVTIIGMEGKENLLDDDGSSFMVHADGDDYVTQPSGGGGERIACGELERTEDTSDSAITTDETNS